jgi:hypothetical protein
MRTTVDLPPAVRRRAEELARERRQSLSAVVAELATLGLAKLEEPLRLDTDPLTGLPVFRIGRVITAEEVAEFLEEE